MVDTEQRAAIESFDLVVALKFGVGCGKLQMFCVKKTEICLDITPYRASGERRLKVARPGWSSRDYEWSWVILGDCAPFWGKHAAWSPLYSKFIWFLFYVQVSRFLGRIEFVVIQSDRLTQSLSVSTGKATTTKNDI